MTGHLSFLKKIKNRSLFRFKAQKPVTFFKKLKRHITLKDVLKAVGLLLAAFTIEIIIIITITN